MDTNHLDDAIFFGLLLSAEIESAEHPLKTEDCPTIPELEQVVSRNAWNLKRLLHTNTCPYCQLTIKLFREEMDIKPWWAEWRERAERAYDSLLGANQKKAAWADAAGGKELVPALLLREGSEPKLVAVEVLVARFTSDQCGRLRLKLEEELPGVPSGTPIEMVIITYPEGQPLGGFLLPTLNYGGEERLKVWLPPEARGAWRKLNEQIAEPKREMPFRLLLRPGDMQGLE